MSQKRKRSPGPSSTQLAESSIYISEPIHDRSSTFTAYYSPDCPPKQLQAHPDIRDASHKILAWRRPSPQTLLRGTFTSNRPQQQQLLYDIGHDDDGEMYGGKRVAKVLEELDVTGACVVARYYGGVLLGPVRFAHMTRCATAAIRKWQLQKESQDEGLHGGVEVKRAKNEEGEKDQTEQVARLARVLRERDQSITVLRALASEKEALVQKAILAGTEALQEGEEERSKDDGEATGQGIEGSAPPTTTATPTQSESHDYSTMPLQRLKMLDKARDATLSFLLKRIDKAETDLAALENPT